MNRVALHAYMEPVLCRPCDVVTRPSWITCLPTKATRSAWQSKLREPHHLLLYSPDFNPIENAISKFKAYLRHAAAGNIEQLWNVIRDAIDTFIPQDCAKYFGAAGYEPDCSNSALVDQAPPTCPGVRAARRCGRNLDPHRRHSHPAQAHLLMSEGLLNHSLKFSQNASRIPFYYFAT
jgi:hypothetical protein